jgi:hypothetical protein
MPNKDIEKICMDIITDNDPDSCFEELLARSKSKLIVEWFNDDKNREEIDAYQFYEDLLCYVVLNGKYVGLKKIVKRGIKISVSICYFFCAKHPQYQMWKRLAKALKIKVTAIIGAYDFEKIPVRFWLELIEDYGADKVLADIKNDSHEFHCPDIESMCIQVKNEKLYKRAQLDQGVLFPKISLPSISTIEH